MTLAAWFLSFLLEVSGAWLSFPKHKPLFVYLSFCAFTDILTFIIMLSAGGDVYGYAAWACHFIEYVLLCWLACYVFAEMVRERLAAIYPAIVSVIFGVVYTFIYASGDTLREKLLDTGISASFMMGGLLLLAVISQKFHLNRQLTFIAWGIVLSLASDGLLVGISRVWLNALHLIPVGSLAALVIWNASVWRKMAIRIEFAK